jgi:hypothetical protein
MHRSLRLALVCAAAIGFLCSAAGAQTAPSPAGSHAARQDVVVPLEQRHASGVKGNVTLHPQGSGTVIKVNMFSGPPALRPVLTIGNGDNCPDVEAASARPIRLKPINTGQTSRTFVAIPFDSFRKSNFVLDVRDATTRAQALEACARLAR